MQQSRHAALMTLVILASNAVGQPPQKPDPEETSLPSTKPIATFDGHTAEVTALAFHRDGKRIVSVSSKEVLQWELESGKVLARLTSDSGEITAIRPDGAAGPTVAIVRINDQRERIVVLRTIPSGKTLLTITPHDAQQKQSPKRGGFWASVATMTFSPDGKRLITAGTSWLVGPGHGLHGGEVKIWDAENGKLIRQLGEVKESEYRYLGNLVEKYIPPNAKVRPGLSTSTAVGAVTFGGDGKYVAVGTDGAGGELPESGEVWIWDATTGKKITMFTIKGKVAQGEWRSAVPAVALSDENKWVAAAVGGRPNRRDGLILGPGPPAELRIWEVASGRQLHSLRGHKGAVTQLAFSPNGKWLASAGSDRAVRLWDKKSGKEVIALPFDTPLINTLRFSPSGDLLAAGGGDGKKSGEVEVWAMPTE